MMEISLLELFLRCDRILLMFFKCVLFLAPPPHLPPLSPLHSPSCFSFSPFAFCIINLGVRINIELTEGGGREEGREGGREGGKYRDGGREKGSE